MGATRSNLEKKRATGGTRRIHKLKRQFVLARPAACTKLVPGATRVRSVRTHGGHLKWRALRLHEGNFSWGSETTGRKARIYDVKYNASSNELVRTKTLVKGAVVVIDATPFRNWYERHYGVYLGNTKKHVATLKPSERLVAKWNKRAAKRTIDKALAQQFKSGRLLARLSSRPGQVGHADGYILEGKELEFYQKKIDVKKNKKA